MHQDVSQDKMHWAMFFLQCFPFLSSMEKPDTDLGKRLGCGQDVETGVDSADENTERNAECSCSPAQTFLP